MCGMWPFAGHPSEVIIWQVGRGIRQPLMNCQASREVKVINKHEWWVLTGNTNNLLNLPQDLLNLCWAYDEDERPDFANGILSLIQKLPKKRLTRSPSHPTHLQHTSEQNFWSSATERPTITNHYQTPDDKPCSMFNLTLLRSTLAVMWMNEWMMKQCDHHTPIPNSTLSTTNQTLICLFLLFHFVLLSSVLVNFNFVLYWYFQRLSSSPHILLFFLLTRRWYSTHTHFVLSLPFLLFPISGDVFFITWNVIVISSWNCIINHYHDNTCN